jgi:tetratricopeptide (TPR) repeat protein
MSTINQIICFILSLLLFTCGSKGKKDGLEDQTAESLLTQAQVAYNAGQYDDCLNLNMMLLENYPTSDLHIDAQLLTAQALGAKEKFEEQFDVLLRLLKENIIPERVPQIYMQIGLFYEESSKWNPGNVTSDTTDYQNAANFYRKAAFYPNSQDRSTKAAALYRTALMHAKLEDIEIATKVYAQVVESFPESPYSTLARTKLLNPANTDELGLPETEPAVVQETTGEEVVPPVEEAESILTPVSTDTVELDLPIEDDESRPPSILDSLQAENADTLGSL